MRRPLPHVLAITSVAAMIACGGGDAPEPAAQEATQAPPGVSGRAPATAEGIPSVVTLEPEDEASVGPPSEPALIDQLGLTFMPTTLMVRSGQTVEFKNSETLAHNVHVAYVDNDSTVFLTDLEPGGTARVTLDREGGYDVTCDVHPGMRAFIYVTSAPYVAFAEDDGSFQMPDVPPGSYTASVWSAAPELRSRREVTVSGPSTVLDLGSQP
jgi:plastocyanin